MILQFYMDDIDNTQAGNDGTDYQDEDDEYSRIVWDRQAEMKHVICRLY